MPYAYEASAVHMRMKRTLVELYHACARGNLGKARALLQCGGGEGPTLPTAVLNRVVSPCACRCDGPNVANCNMSSRVIMHLTHVLHPECAAYSAVDFGQRLGSMRVENRDSRESVSGSERVSLPVARPHCN